jgi:hypothetical protein
VRRLVALFRLPYATLFADVAAPTRAPGGRRDHYRFRSDNALVLLPFPEGRNALQASFPLRRRQ